MITVGLTGMIGSDSPGPGLSVARCLKNSPLTVRLIGLGYDALEAGLFDYELFDHHYIIPYPSQGKDNFEARLSYIIEKEKIDILIPNLDAELVPFINSSKFFEKLGTKMFLPTVEQFQLRSKNLLYDYCKKNDIPVPFTVPITDLKSFYEAQHLFTYPIMIKGLYYDAYMAHNYEEACAYIHKLSMKWGYPVIIQQCIQGIEFDVAAFGDGNGELVGAVPMKKLAVTDKGKAWTAVTIKDDGLMDITRKIISDFSWRGACEVEIIRSSLDEQYYLIEINPRFPAWIFLTSGCGINLPYYCVMYALNRENEIEKANECPPGRLYIRTIEELIRDISDLEEISISGELDCRGKR